MTVASDEVSPTSTAELLQEAEQSLMYVVTRPEKVMVQGKGSYLWDNDGKRYLDFLAGWAVNCLGHSPPVLVQQLHKQAQLLANASPALLNEPMIRFAKLLTENSCLDKVFFGSSGAEANEGAVKLARKYGQRKLDGAYEIVTMWNGFHGRTLATMSASGKQAWDTLFEPKVPGFVRAPLNDLSAVQQSVSNKTCAIMVEPVQGEAGVYPAQPEFMQGLRDLCDERGILLILDEIQTGIGRTGTLFSYEQYGIEPDVMTLGKGLGGGFPVAALLAKNFACVFDAGDQGGTYTAQPLAMVAGHAVVNEVIAKNIPHKAQQRGTYLRRQLEAMAEEFGFTEIRGQGLLMAVALREPKASAVVAACLDEGLLLNAPRTDTIRFMPALTITNEEIDEMVEILSGVLRQNL